MSDEVLVEHDDGMAIVTINRPEQRNAVNRAVSQWVNYTYQVRIPEQSNTEVWQTYAARGCFQI